MTRKEEIEREALSYSETLTNGHYDKDLVCGFEAGAQWADETMIKRVCEWLQSYGNRYFEDCGIFGYDFQLTYMIRDLKVNMKYKP